MVLPILHYKVPILRQKAKSVEDPKAGDVQRLILDMKETVKAKQGVGLAGPQVGEDLRVIVVNLKECFGLINPEIVKVSKKTSVLEEGCLSIPGFFSPIERPEKVTVKALDEKGKKVKIKAKGLLARVLQHEVDHLNGILIIDKAKDK